MEQNLAAWMIAGGPRSEDPHAARDREHLRAYLESRRAARAEQPRLITRIREIVQPSASRPEPACCPA
jgi:hypothetical protein